MPSSEMTRKAQALIDEGRVTEEDNVVLFTVDSGSPESPYKVLVGSPPDCDPNEIRITCDCRAGKEGKACYHVLAVLMIMRNEEEVNADGTQR